MIHHRPNQQQASNNAQAHKIEMEIMITTLSIIFSVRFAASSTVEKAAE